MAIASCEFSDNEMNRLLGRVRQQWPPKSSGQGDPD
jgi:hypothetical protein